MRETTARLPEWVVTSAGRQVPFDPDAISQALYLASETLGRPNAFLARELADAVLHFLALEAERIPTTAQIDELIVKVVTGLDQPAIARAFADRPRREASAPPLPAPAGRFDFALQAAPADVLRDCLHAYSLQAVYARDLAAALGDGLLVLAADEHPGRLASLLAPLPFAATDVLDLLRELHRHAAVVGQRLVLDGPEWHPLGADGPALARTLHALAELSACHVVVHLNSLSTPAWASALGSGPLFAADGSAERAPTAVADALLDALHDERPAHLHLAWHYRAGDRDLARLARRALEGRPLTFVPERERHPVALTEGLDRRCPAVLMEIGLSLPALLAWPDVAGDATRFLDKLPSLARMAVRLGVQKRNFLRGRSSDDLAAHGFLRERARLVLVPRGLDAVVHTLTGATPARSPASLEAARRMVRAIRQAMQTAARQAHLEAVLDLPGLDTDAAATPRKQLRAAAKLREDADSGSAHIVVPTSGDLPAVLDLLQHAAARTELTRLTLSAPPPALQQGELVPVDTSTHG